MPLKDNLMLAQHTMSCTFYFDFLIPCPIYFTEDGCIISCRQWKSNLKGDEQLNPVLLLNAYAIESFWLPTEPIDLVRTLLQEGHETWLLNSRLHPLNPSNDFTIEDVGKFDIPAGKRFQSLTLIVFSSFCF